MIEVKETTKNKAAVCEKILRSLPDWFALEGAILDYIKNSEDMPMLIVNDGNDVVGFISLKIHNKLSAEIYVMAVLEAYHGQKIGKALVEAAEKYLSKQGFKFLSVKTLSESRPDPFYDKTRKFYLATGFAPIEEFKTLWDEANPCLLLIKALN